MQDAEHDPLNFFIIYDIADRSWAEWIDWQLRFANYLTRIEAWDFRPGSNIVLEEHNALIAAEQVLIVLSPEALKSPTIQPIWTAALVNDGSGGEKLLPIQVRNCAPRDLGLLGPIKIIDLVGLDESNARDVLLKGVDSKRKRSTTKPVFPGELPELTREPPRFPGYLPPIWEMPRYNQFFTDREDILLRLHTAFKSGEVGLVNIQAICGLGGIGKTQTAIAYAYRYSHNYQAILWINATSRKTFNSDLLNIMGKLDPSKKSVQDEQQTIIDTKRWLEDHTDWLLIIDNLEYPDILSGFMPSVGNGHILVTTRTLFMGTFAQSIELNKLKPEDGALFLLRRAKLISMDATLGDISTTDWAKALAISFSMGSLPLALDQAGAYIEEAVVSPEDYLHHYSRQGVKLLNRRGVISSMQPSEHPEPVNATWSSAFNKIRSHPAASKLLFLCAFLYPDAIPEDIITKGLSEIADELDDAITELRKYSFLSRNISTGMLSIHPLVQVVLRAEMDQPTQIQWAEYAIRAIINALPDSELRILQHCLIYFPHVQISAAHIEQWNITFEDAARLLVKMAQLLREHALDVESDPLFLQAFSIRKKMLAMGQPYIASVLDDYASVLRNIHRNDEAEELEASSRAIRDMHIQQTKQLQG